MTNTHSDPFHHEADVANTHEVCTLINSINGLHMTGDLKENDMMKKCLTARFNSCCVHNTVIFINNIFCNSVTLYNYKLNLIFLHITQR